MFRDSFNFRFHSEPKVQSVIILDFVASSLSFIPERIIHSWAFVISARLVDHLAEGAQCMRHTENSRDLNRCCMNLISPFLASSTLSFECLTGPSSCQDNGRTTKVCPDWRGRWYPRIGCPMKHESFLTSSLLWYVYRLLTYRRIECHDIILISASKESALWIPVEYQAITCQILSPIVASHQVEIFR